MTDEAGLVPPGIDALAVTDVLAMVRRHSEHHDAEHAVASLRVAPRGEAARHAAEYEVAQLRGLTARLAAEVVRLARWARHGASCALEEGRFDDFPNARRILDDLTGIRSPREPAPEPPRGWVFSADGRPYPALTDLNPAGEPLEAPEWYALRQILHKQAEVDDDLADRLASQILVGLRAEGFQITFVGRSPEDATDGR